MEPIDPLQYIKDIQRLSWRDLGYDAQMARILGGRSDQEFLGGADMDGYFEDGGLTSMKFSELSGNRIIAKTIQTDKLTVGSLNFVSSIVWTPTDQNTATWAAGTLTFSDGKQYSILAGNTGNISATTYIYLDINTSANTLQTTTTIANATGDGKTLITIVELGADSSSKCNITIMQGGAGTMVTGNRITTGTLTSAYIDVGTGASSSYVRLDGPNNRIVVHDGTNPRIVIGNV